MAKSPASILYRHALQAHFCLVALVSTPVRGHARQEVCCDDVVALAQIYVNVSFELPKNKSAKGSVRRVGTSSGSTVGLVVQADPKGKLISTQTASKKEQSKSGSSSDEESAMAERGRGEIEIGALLRALPGKTSMGRGGKEYFREGDFGRVAKITKDPAGSWSLHIVWERTGQTSAITKVGWWNLIEIVQKPPLLQVGSKLEVLQGKTYVLPNGTNVYSDGDAGKVVAVNVNGNPDQLQILWERSGIKSVMTRDKWPNYFLFMDAWYLKRKTQEANSEKANIGGKFADSAHQQSLKAKTAQSRKARQRTTQRPQEEEEEADLSGTQAPSPSPRMNGDLDPSEKEHNAHSDDGKDLQEDPSSTEEPSELEIGPGETSTTNNVFDERELYTEHVSSEDDNEEEGGKGARSEASTWRATHLGAAAIASLAMWRGVP